MATVEVYLQSEFPYKAKLNQLTKEFKNSVSLKMDVGKVLKSLTQQTFEKQADPWGTPWKPSQRVLKEKGAFDAWTAGGKSGKRPKNKRGAYLTGEAQTLLLTGRLRNSFEVVNAGHEVSFVAKTSAKGKTGGISNVVYFPTHQFGYKAKNVPARPMMPIRGGQVDMPPAWSADIVDVIKKWMSVHAA
jgi:phage gpG-like protein